MTPDEVDILVAALDDCQDIVRKFARLRHPQMDRSYFGEIELLEHLKSAIHLLQDYQKLREKIKETIIDIELEISSRPKYPNIGKKGCVERLKQIIQQPTEH